jgi:hypothetical protein
MESLEFLTEEEKNAMSVNDLAVYLDILNYWKRNLRSFKTKGGENDGRSKSNQRIKR